MRPQLTPDDLPDVPMTDAVDTRYRAVTFCERPASYFENDFGGQLGAAVTSASWVEPISSRVPVILYFRYPLKILRSIIRLVRILVVRYLSFTRHAKEGHRHESVDEVMFAPVVLPKEDGTVAVRSQERTQYPACHGTHASPHAPHTAAIRNVVETLVSDHWQPRFVHGIYYSPGVRWL